MTLSRPPGKLTSKRNAPVYFVKSGEEAEEFLKCKASVFYFIMTYLKIVHPMFGKVPFMLYPFQIAVLKQFLTRKYSITLKPRQMGMSTLVCAYILWLVLFHSHKSVLLVSIKQALAKSLLKKVRRMYDGLPDFLKVEVVNGERGGSGTVTHMVLANGSEVQAVAATEDAGRSEALSLLIMDEVAFQQAASSIWGAAQQTLATGGQGILLSTAYGMGNFFHESWEGAVQGLNGMFPIKLDWRMHPERNQAWYEEQSKLLGRKRTAQEIDCDFLKSGYNVFDLGRIRAIEERLSEMKPWREGYDGALKLYWKPRKGESYVIGGDIASGRARDYSTFSIMNMKGKEMGCFKGKLGVREFAYLMMEMGELYNWALLAPECNSIGEGPLAIMQDNNYPQIFHSLSKTLKLEAFDRDESMIPGWLTTGKSRHEIITGLDDDLEEELVELYNPFFCREAYTFIYNEANKPIALGKEMNKGGSFRSKMLLEEESAVSYSDDAIFSVCIANEVRKSPHKYKGNLPLYAGAA